MPAVAWNRYLCFLTLVFAGCGADLITKSLIFDWLGVPSDQENIYWLWEGYIGIQTAVNQGALFGLGQGYSVVFAVLSLVAGCGILYWLFVRRAANDWLLTIALGCVMGGILGNLYDRLGLWHGDDVASNMRNGVRDWILLRYESYTWPNFNIADSLLVCGAAALMWHALWYGDRRAREQAPEKAGS